MLQLVYAPNPIFKQKAEHVAEVNDEIRGIADAMLDTMYREHAVGLGANMVGILKRVAVLDLQKNSRRDPMVLINPEITWYSEECRKVEEASVCFLGIKAEVLRPRSIKVRYVDYDGSQQEIEATDSLARVIQHEVDYLHGVTFLDRLSKLKRDMLLDKMIKFRKQNIPHVHTANCRH